MSDEPLFTAEERAELERLQKQAADTQATIDRVATHTVEMCLQESKAFLDSADRELQELPGTEHPALFDVTQACRWLLEAVQSMQPAPAPAKEPR